MFIFFVLVIVHLLRWEGLFIKWYPLLQTKTHMMSSGEEADAFSIDLEDTSVCGDGEDVASRSSAASSVQAACCREPRLIWTGRGAFLFCPS